MSETSQNLNQYKEQFDALCTEVRELKKIFPKEYTMGQLMKNYQHSKGGLAQYVYYLVSIGFAKKVDKNGTYFYSFVPNLSEVVVGLEATIEEIKKALSDGNIKLTQMQILRFAIEKELKPSIPEPIAEESKPIQRKRKNAKTVSEDNQ